MMALKDLVASKASLAEETIEEIVSDYVRYDAEDKSVFLTPSSHDLPTRNKVLVYLVALQGWPYVLSESVPVDAKPAEIEERTGIAGGTLRPILKELKDRNVIHQKAGRYSVRAVALGHIKEELDGSPEGTSKRANKPAAKKGVTVRKTTTSVNKKPKKKSSRPSSGIGIADRFSTWIKEGYFDKPRTLSDLQQKFHDAAIIIPRTSLPTYLLKAVRDGHLNRKKQSVGGRTVWVYSRSRSQ